MKTLALTSQTYSLLTKAIFMLAIALFISNCASNKNNSGPLKKIKTKQGIYKERSQQNSLVGTEKDLVERDFQGKLRSTLSGHQFNTSVWSSNCDCR